MTTRQAFICSLALLAACGDRVIGSAYDSSESDGGLSGAEADDLLAKYALELKGRWRGSNSDRSATFLVDFTPSDLPRNGTASSTLQMDCSFPLPRALSLCGEPGPGPPVPPTPIEWNAEYWLLKLQGTNATVSMLPDPEDIIGVTFTCLYLPAQPRLECGITLGGLPIIQTVLTRYSP
jgi:hypothetical protein